MTVGRAACGGLCIGGLAAGAISLCAMAAKEFCQDCSQQAAQACEGNGSPAVQCKSGVCGGLFASCEWECQN